MRSKRAPAVTGRESFLNSRAFVPLVAIGARNLSDSCKNETGVDCQDDCGILMSFEVTSLVANEVNRELRCNSGTVRPLYAARDFNKIAIVAPFLE